MGPKEYWPACQWWVAFACEPVVVNASRWRARESPSPPSYWALRVGEACARWNRSMACTSWSPARKVDHGPWLSVLRSSWIRSGSGLYWSCFTEKRETAMMETLWRHQLLLHRGIIIIHGGRQRRPEHDVTAGSAAAVVAMATAAGAWHHGTLYGYSLQRPFQGVFQCLF